MEGKDSVIRFWEAPHARDWRECSRTDAIIMWRTSESKPLRFLVLKQRWHDP